MAKIIKVESCSKCPYIQHVPYKASWCEIAGKDIEGLEFPDWCPLPNVQENTDNERLRKENEELKKTMDDLNRAMQLRSL